MMRCCGLTWDVEMSTLLITLRCDLGVHSTISLDFFFTTLFVPPLSAVHIFLFKRGQKRDSRGRLTSSFDELFSRGFLPMYQWVI